MQPNKYSGFLPIERYVLRTTLSEEEVLERLQIITRTAETIRFSPRTAALLRSNYDYDGAVSGKSFEIWRSINYRNTFLPVITGIVSSDAHKTEIRIAMNMNLFARTISIIGFSMACIAAFITFNFYPLSFKAFIPVIGIIFSYLVIFLGFKLEARISKKDLNTIFKSEANQ